MSKKSVMFGNFIRKYKDDPEKFQKWLKTGMGLENKIRKRRANNGSFIDIINYLTEDQIYSAIKGENSAWVNLLAPSEILSSLGYYPVSAEGIGAMMCSMHLEDYSLSLASQAGVPDSLCSFHRSSIGVSRWKIFPKPQIVLTTSILCDGNITAFKKISKEYNVPFFLIDVPRGRKREYVPYVVKQLEELIKTLEEITGKKYPYDLLKEELVREKKTIDNIKKSMKLLSTKTMNIKLYEHLNMLYIFHTMPGNSLLYEGSKKLVKELQEKEEFQSKRLLWMHLPPYYDNELFEVFSPESKFQVITDELSSDWIYDLNPEKPLQTLAEKMVFNPEAGTVKERADYCYDLSKDLNIQGIIHFSHWGCRQSSGASGYLSNYFSEKKIPFLELNGDCVDHNSESAGQLKTRIGAFLEIMEGEK